MDNKTYTVAVIGAGQLGSRHLQGILKSKLSLKVFVVDPFQKSLETAESRANEIENKHTLQFHTSISNLPEQLDFGLIASNADNRAEIIQNLLEHSKVTHLVLEKVLFQKLEDYKVIGNLLADHQVKTWVNHPRRSQPIYKELSARLENESQIDFSFYGENWGLACNGLHMLDIISQLSNSPISTISMKNIDSKILESKRAGNIEITGTLSGKTGNSNTFSVTSSFAEETIRPVSLTINTPEKRFFIQEGMTCFLIESSLQNGFKAETTTFPLIFQSDLSDSLVTEILTDGTCDLPSYEEAKSTHMVFIKEVLDFYNRTTQKNVNVCPIT
ncbi:MAG: Gfo/Idh/MocA family oxidoreductase [Salibacteraceae bacterium]